MRRRLIPFTLPLAVAGLVLAGCAVTAPPASVGDTSVSTSQTSTEAITEVDSTIPAAAAELLAANADGTVVKDDEWNIADAVDVTLSGATAASDSSSVAVDGSTVTISAAGVYRLSGTLDGQVVVDAPEDALVVLVLDGATVTNTGGAGIHVVSADDVAIALAAGSTNTITAASSADADASAAIYADTDLTISGSGSLSVTDSGNDGISATDDLAIIGGTITVDAADDGLRGKDSLVVRDGTVSITAGGDALKSDQTDDATKGYVWIAGGTVDATAGDDGVDAQTDAVITGGTITLATDDDGIHSETALAIAGGQVDITRSYEGIESADIRIAGGATSVTSSDDGVNASGNSTSSGGMGGGGMQDSGETLTISDGTLQIDADGDGLDSNGTITMTGGDITVYGPTANDNGALDSNGGITVSGGTLVAIGSSGMAESPETSSPQGWLAAAVDGSDGSSIRITDATGAVIASYVGAKDFQTVVFSSSAITSGQSYTVTVDGTSTTVTAGEAVAGGMGGGMGGGRP